MTAHKRYLVHVPLHCSVLAGGLNRARCVSKGIPILRYGLSERFGFIAIESPHLHSQPSSFHPRRKPVLRQCVPFEARAYTVGTGRYLRLSSKEVFLRGAFHGTATFADCRNPLSSVVCQAIFHQHGYPSRKPRMQYPAGRSKRRCRRSMPNHRSPVRDRHA